MRKYKLFLHILLLLVVLLGSSSGLFAAIAAGETVPEHITLTWSEDPKTTQTITWQTAATTVDGLVQYAEAMNKQLLPLHAVRIAADVTALHTNTGSVAVHSATLTGLKPNTRYVYQVGGISGWSQPQYFTTAPATDKAFSFLVFGDSQSMNYGTWEKTLHNAFRVNHQAAFLPM